MREKRTWNLNPKLPWVMLFVSLSGFCLFYLLPFFLSFVYSIWENPVSRKYCGLQHYQELFHNTYFLRGLRNTAGFMAVSIPVNIMLSLGAAFVVRRAGRFANVISLLFLIPLAIPSATSAFFWENFFGLHGTLNRFLSVFQIEGIDWLDSEYSMLVMVVIFVWKNVGYDMALFLGGLGSIPEEYYEYAALERAGGLWKFRHITMVYLMPTMFVALIMTVVNSFQVFREIYILSGDYPSDHLYVLQHWMNHMFSSLDYSRLVSAAYILTATMVLFVVCVFRTERKISDDLHF